MNLLFRSADGMPKACTTMKKKRQDENDKVNVVLTCFNHLLRLVFDERNYIMLYYVRRCGSELHKNIPRVDNLDSCKLVKEWNLWLPTWDRGQSKSQNEVRHYELLLVNPVMGNFFFGLSPIPAATLECHSNAVVQIGPRHHPQNSGRHGILLVIDASSKRFFTQRSDFLRLATAQNHVLTDLEESLEGAGIQDGDHLTAVTLPPKLSSTGKAFALWCSGEDKVVTWGTPEYGGDSSQSQISSRVWSKFKLQSAHLLPPSPMDPQWHGVIHIMVVTALQSVVNSGVCNRFRPQTVHLLSFAAILANGTVVTWGQSLLWWCLLCSPKSKLNLGVCSKFKRQSAHLLQSWLMDLL